MKTVYTLSSGQYSDYSIEAVFEQRQAAVAAVVVMNLRAAAQYERWVTRNKSGSLGFADHQKKAAMLRANPEESSDAYVEEFTMYEAGDEWQPPAPGGGPWGS